MTFFVDPFAPYDSPHHPVNAGKQVRPRGEIPPPDLTDADLQYLVDLWPFMLNTFGLEEEQGREFDPWLGEELIGRRAEYRDLLERYGTDEELDQTSLAENEEDEDEYGDNAPTLRDLLGRRDAHQAETVVAPQDEHVDEQPENGTLAADLEAISAEALTRPAASAPKAAWKAHLRALDPSVSDEDAEAMTVDVLKARTRELAASRP